MSPNNAGNPTNPPTSSTTSDPSQSARLKNDFDAKADATCATGTSTSGPSDSGQRSTATQPSEHQPSSEQLQASARATAQDAKAKAAEAKKAADEQIHRATDKAMSSGRDYMASKKAQIAEELGVLRDAVDEAANTLDEKDHQGVATYVHAVAEQIDRCCQGLDKRSTSDLLHDAQNFTRRRPDIVYGTMFFAGLGLMRFLKASADRQRQNADLSTDGRSWDHDSWHDDSLDDDAWQSENFGHANVQQRPSRARTARPASPVIPRPSSANVAGPAPSTITPNQGASLQPRTDFRHK